MPPIYDYTCSECGGEIELLLNSSDRDRSRTHSMEDCPGNLTRILTPPNFIGSRSASYLDGQIPAERKKEFDELRKVDKLTIEKADLMANSQERKEIDRELNARENGQRAGKPGKSNHQKGKKE